MRREIIYTERAAHSAFPTSQGAVVGELVWTSGHGPLDPQSGQAIEGDIEAQVERTLENLRQVLESAGASLNTVVKVNCYLRNLEDLQAFNQAYAAFFERHRAELPPRTTILADLIRPEIDVEMEAIAVREGID